jgi:hypothetical protein
MIYLVWLLASSFYELLDLYSEFIYCWEVTMQHFNGLSLMVLMAIGYWLVGMSKKQKVKSDKRSISLELQK